MNLRWMKQASIRTPLGIATILGDENGIQEIKVDDSTEESSEIPEVLQSAILQLQQYFSGKRQDFDLKLSPKGTDFQKKVWEELRNIPYGTTVSYLELSRKLLETAPGVSVEDVQNATEGKLIVEGDIPEMQL